MESCREIDETFNVHTLPYGGIRQDNDSNFVHLVPCICNEIRAQQLPSCVDRRIGEKKKTKRGVSTFELFFFWKKQRRFERYNARELRLFSVKFSKARSQDIRVSAPRLTIDRDTLQLRNLPVPSNELTIRRQFVRYRLHAIYTFPGSLNYGTVGRTLCDIRKWTWNNQCL